MKIDSEAKLHPIMTGQLLCETQYRYIIHCSIKTIWFLFFYMISFVPVDRLCSKFTEILMQIQCYGIFVQMYNLSNNCMGVTESTLYHYSVFAFALQYVVCNFRA